MFIEFSRILGDSEKTIFLNTEAVETIEEKEYQGKKVTEIRLSSSLTLMTHESVASLKLRLEK